MPASYPGSVKSFTTKVNGVDSPDADHINDLQLEVSAIETDLLKAPTDYSATSTIVGWASFTRKVLNYFKIGKMVYVHFDIIGTSNATSTSFTLPFALAAGSYFINTAIRVQDNGGATQAGFISITGGSNVATAYFDFAATGWTASGTKRIVGELFYFTG